MYEPVMRVYLACVKLNELPLLSASANMQVKTPAAKDETGGMGGERK